MRFLLSICMTIILLVTTSGEGVWAQQRVKKDSSSVTLKKIPSPGIETYRSQKDFNYTVVTPEGLSLWDRFWLWVWSTYNRLMEKEYARTGLKIALWTISIGVILYAILKYMGMEKVMLWVTGDSERAPAYHVEAEHIYGIDFDSAIALAVSGGHYRHAIRLHYLKALRQLSDSGQIHWSPEKTNIDYAEELTGKSLSDDFERITRVYEYAWYGEFPVSQDLYLQAKELFTPFNLNTTG
jgi:hypothetical protein